MYPSDEVPYGGIFVKNQYEYLKNNFKEHSFEIKAMKRRRTSSLGSLYKYFVFLLSSFSYLFRRYDVVHIHYLSYHFTFGMIYKVFHPSSTIILTLHGSDVNMFTENRLIRKFTNKLFKSFRVKTICVGKKLAENFFNTFNLNADYILAAGVDDRLFLKKENVEKVYDLIFVGTFSELKGADLLCDVIKSSNQNIKWCLIGAGTFLKELESIKSDFNLDIFTDLAQSEIAMKLNQSRYFILPSRSEGFPLASLEALYCGVPVICSNIDQFKEQVQDEYNGYIIGTYEIADIKRVIEKAFITDKEKYETMSKNALSSNKEYSLGNVCRKLVEIYEKERAA